MRRFMDVADIKDEGGAIQTLKEASWNMEHAFELYFYTARSNSASRSSTNTAGIDEMFSNYKVKDNEQEERIEAEGIIRLLHDIGVDPLDPVTLVISLKMSAETMGKYTKEEFYLGMRTMQCDSMDKLKKKIGDLRRELDSAETFKDVYEFSFHFALEPNAKALPLETAIGLWKVLMVGKWCFTDEWCEFLEKNHGKAISNDTWSQVLQFSKLVGPKLEGYTVDDAWPYLLDEFVEWKTEQN